LPSRLSRAPDQFDVPLDPYNLTPEVSLNRVRLVSGAQLQLPPDLEGRAAGEVLSAAAVEGLSTEAQAERLVYLLATLKLGEAQVRAARPEWDDSHWEHWAGIERVYLAGGRATAELVDATGRRLRRFNLDIAVVLAPDPVSAPLIGAARSLGVTAGMAYVLDFGGTAVKRGIACFFKDGALAPLEVVDALPSPHLNNDRSPEAIARIIASTIEAPREGAIDSVQVGVSIASYVRDDHPLDPPHAGYVTLDGIDNLSRWLEREVGRRLGCRVTVRLLHDGTAAALSISPSPRTAVITLGTYLGIGFARE
jgi:hypothetical protein